MDYLERLDKSLKTLENESEQLANLPDLIREIGKVADNVSDEKDELNALTEKLTGWSDSLDAEFKNMTQALETNHENIQKVNLTMIDNQNRTEDTLQRMSRAMQDNQGETEKNFQAVNQTLQNNQDKTEKNFQTVNQTLQDNQEKTDKQFQESHTELESLKTELSGYMDEIRAKNKTLKTLSIISIVISLICCGMLTWILLHI